MTNIADYELLKHDIIVLSDLHLGEGLSKNEPRYSPTEDFFYDCQFENFLKFLHRKYLYDPEGLVLVLNGDIFDFLTVTSTPSKEEAKARGFRVSAAERQFGLNPTAEKSVYKLDVIAGGHKHFFRALARFVAGGHRVHILRGNHDLELYFPQVQDRLLEHLSSYQDGPSKEEVAAKVEFHPWFYLEPGRVYIEHGNQYDSTNSIRYPMHPMLPSRRWWSTEGEEVLDYPLGSIFVRFFYNRVRRIDPYTPRLLSFEQYWSFIRRYNLFDIWRVYKDHYPHFVAALGPTTTTGSARSTGEEDARQEAAFDELEKTENGQLYRSLNAFKIYPASASKPGVVKEMISPILRRGMWIGLFLFIVLFVWFGILQLIDMIPWVTANAFVMSLFAVLTMGGAFWAWIHLQRKLRRMSVDLGVEDFVDRADKIASLLDVKMILMGHTHMVDYRKVNDGQTVYANSGTWTTVDNPWNRIMRDARKNTFLYIKEDDVQLSRWNDDAGRIDSVPLFYLEDEKIPDNLSFDPAFEMSTSKEGSWLPSAAISAKEEDYVVRLSNDPPPPR